MVVRAMGHVFGCSLDRPPARPSSHAAASASRPGKVGARRYAVVSAVVGLVSFAASDAWAANCSAVSALTVSTSVQLNTQITFSVNGATGPGAALGLKPGTQYNVIANSGLYNACVINTNTGFPITGSGAGDTSASIPGSNGGVYTITPVETLDNGTPGNGNAYYVTYNLTMTTARADNLRHDRSELFVDN